MEILIPIIQDGKVSPYLNNAILTDQFIIPAEVDTVNLTWQAGQESRTSNARFPLPIHQHIGMPAHPTHTHLPLSQQLYIISSPHDGPPTEPPTEPLTEPLTENR
ncbi:wnt inhibitory factor 1, partial [Biomphalaria glabrata]